jgi:uncharacterized protein (TIGR03086 family)
VAVRGCFRAFIACWTRVEETRLPQWRNGRLDDDPCGAYERSAALVDEALGAEGVLDRKFSMPEVRDGGRFPAAVAIGFHLVDTVVHAWDVAASIGVPWRPDEELVAASLTIALKVPDGPADRGPGLAFERAIDVSAETPDRDRLLALLGRSPGWSHPAPNQGVPGSGHVRYGPGSDLRIRTVVY